VGREPPDGTVLLLREPHGLQPLPRKKKLRTARFSTSISEFDRNLVLEEGGRQFGDRVHVVRCGIEMESWTSLERRPEAGRVLSVGALREKKGHHVLVEALGRLRDEGVEARAEIVGEGAERARLEADVARLGLGARVDLVGALSPEETRERYARAEIFALACVVARNGDLDGVPIVLMEAMMAGIPCVSTRLAGISELVEDGVSGLLAEPGDAAGLGERIGRLRRDASLRERMGRAARERALSLCDARRNVAGLAQLLEEAIR
jgi:glycosyltransferase involved in cell wall biosynthesis